MTESLVLLGPPIRGRHCGDCQLCCTLLPVRSIGKGANSRCRHQRHGKGCSLYPERPPECRAFSCRWLMDETTDGLPRPDRAGYVIDPAPDVLLVNGHPVDCIQVWVDPKRRDAHRDPRLRDWIELIGSRYGMPTLVRFNERDGIVLAPPSITNGLGWMEYPGGDVLSEDEAQALLPKPDRRYQLSLVLPPEN